MGTHGNVAESEAESTTALREGFGVTFTIRGGQRDWIHIPIPTPVFVGDRRISLTKAMYLFHAANGAILRLVQFYDGRTPVLNAVREVNYTGDYSTRISGDLEPHNWWKFG